jgi:hypothetical protein
MRRINLQFVKLVSAFFVLITLPYLTVSAGGKKEAGGSEIVVQRVDNNSLIRLRIYIDGKIAGSLKVGETTIFKVKNGPHTIRAAFEDYQARSTEVTQFIAANSRIIFTVTDESIVAVSQENLDMESLAPAPAPSPSPEQSASPAGVPLDASTILDGYSLETAVSNAFERATKNIKKKAKVAVVNIDADNQSEGYYILEELTYLMVDSPKKFTVIDRRTIDAFRSTNGVGVPSYNNDYMLMLVGKLLGADVVMSGRLDGGGDLRRLRVKALDVNSGMLIGDASERP